MTPERIAKLRRMAWGCMSGRMYPQETMDEVLDALEAAQAWIAELTAAGGGTLGELTEEVSWDLLHGKAVDNNLQNRLCARIGYSFARALIRQRFRALPSQGGGAG
jgi:hypothetical protein